MTIPVIYPEARYTDVDRVYTMVLSLPHHFLLQATSQDIRLCSRFIAVL